MISTMASTTSRGTYSASPYRACRDLCCGKQMEDDMNLLTDYYFSITDDPTETPETISSFVSQNITRLIRSFQADGLDVVSLITRMVPEDFMGRYKRIHKLIPGFRDEDYLKTISNPEDYWPMMVEEGLPPDSVIKAWPLLLNFEQKLDIGVSPDLVMDTTEHLDLSDAEELLACGADPDKVAARVNLTRELMIEYGVNPKSIIESAMKYDALRVRENIRTLLRRGLTAEDLLEAEIKALYYNFYDRQWIIDWYIENLELIAEHSEDKGGLAEKLIELVDEIYYEDDCMSAEEGDQLFLRMMKACVKHDLINIDDAVKRLYDVHPDVREDEYGKVTPFESVLLDEDYVHTELMKP